jgi:cation transporter-like permease
MFIETAHAGGVIDNAPTFAHVFFNTLMFLLQVAGIVGIIGVVITGMLYFFAGGNPKMIETAKKMSWALIVGFVFLFGSWVIIRTISGFFL